MRRRILQALAARGLLDPGEAERILSDSKWSGIPLGKILLEETKVPEGEFLRAVAEYLGISFKEDLAGERGAGEFIEKVPIEYALHYSIMGLGGGNGAVRVATADPLDAFALDEVALRLGKEVVPLAAPREVIRSFISGAYEMDLSSVDTMLGSLDSKDLEGLTREVARSEDLADMANKAPIVKLLNTILFQALKERASDVHVQPFERHVQVRYRVDGILYDVMRIPKAVQEAVVSRIKVMGRMDIAERRLPQDGQTSFVAGGRAVDVRISTIPSVHGERVVMRLQDKSTGIYDIRKIGLLDDHLEKVEKLIRMAHGIILVTGPTGSGKTTTLYAALKEVNSPEKNIITVEDPVEYQLPGISQIQVSNKKGMTFATGLRSIVRQDPDVIMVGEIRDLETASIAIQSALTGHLVFSTLHTNDAPGAVSRLLDLGVEPYLVNSSLLAVVAQRLVRRVCPACRVRVEPSREELAALGGEAGAAGEGTYFRASGCRACQEKGYLGRLGIFEILEIDDEVKELIGKRASSTRIKRNVLKRGKMRTLRMDGLLKAGRGWTTLEEVRRVTQMDIA